jgi:hypothetical protein
MRSGYSEYEQLSDLKYGYGREGKAETGERDGGMKGTHKSLTIDVNMFIYSMEVTGVI